jgi:hypothetical protein
MFSKCATNSDGKMRWCKACASLCFQVWWVENRGEYLDANRQRTSRYRKDNAQQINRSNRLYEAERRKRDPGFKLRCNLRARIWKALNGIGKVDRSMKLLGCSLNFYRSYLETAFVYDHPEYGTMTWDNYGDVWEVDHQRPCASFDLTDPKQQLECFHWSNCQPMFTELNRQKGNRYAGK